VVQEVLYLVSRRIQTPKNLGKTMRFLYVKLGVYADWEWEGDALLYPCTKDVNTEVDISGFRLAVTYTPTIKSQHGTSASLQQAPANRQPSALPDP
jgi:hypothetical protein